MENTLKKALLDRTDKLLRDADAVIKTGDHQTGQVNISMLSEWQTSVEFLIGSAVSQSGPHYKNFRQIFDKENTAKDTTKIQMGIGILRSVKENLESGFVDRVKYSAHADVLESLLESAQDSLNGGSKDAAAVLLGPILENGLRKIAEENGVKIKGKSSIGLLDKKLTQKGVYESNDMGKWNDIRTAAAHGKFDEYDDKEVKEMMRGVRKFLAQNL